MKEYIVITPELGNLIRRARKRKRARQEDLADEIISTATISNIERGACQVSREKLDHLCKKIGVDLNKTSSILQVQDFSEEDIKNRLVAIENDIDLVSADFAQEELRKIHLEKNDPLLADYYFLKAKCYAKKELIPKAHSYYLKSIKEVDTHEYYNSNIKAASYYEIGRILHTSDVDEALRCVEKGLESFVPNKQRRYIEYYLKVSKAIYLEKLNRAGEALQILEELWAEKEVIPSTEVLLNMYDTQAKIYYKMEIYEKSISIAKEGIERARIDRMYDRSFELWTTLGSCYVKQGRLSDAQRCFRTALNLEKEVKREYLLISTQTQLGLLYLKQKKFKFAKIPLEEAVQLGRKCKDILRLNEALVALGDCLFAEGNKSKAKQYYKEALELTNKEKKEKILVKLMLCTEENSKEYKMYEKDFIQMHISTLKKDLLQEGGENNMRSNSQVRKIKLNSAGDPPDA
ncbi:hypothetical protein C1X05_14795 [Laceyella sacchari]|uniref:TolA-binding protein n=1 Tax=Laceyella tengchongensis TaxID=574699 RepID=A0AA45WPN0_9BACL|nr:tetratricopeptide repeat protein [Laceyella tengchongensis]AUS09968.1 hypothetical protein C1X05_14795 [Laceyella sacchari]SMP22446.1 TolA-binding protein [Laceyella tengchongensis]